MILLMIKICITLRTLEYGNYGIFLVMGNAGSVSSTVRGPFRGDRRFVERITCVMEVKGRDGSPKPLNFHGPS